MNRYERAAQEGVDVAMYNLGVLYAHGQGVPTDFKKAIFWYVEFFFCVRSPHLTPRYEKAVAAGSGPAALNLGNMYRDGRGCKADWTMAGNYFSEMFSFSCFAHLVLFYYSQVLQDCS